MSVTVEELLNAEEEALTKADGVEAPGMCWRFQRLTIEELGLPSPGPGLDAKQAARWFKRKGFAVDPERTLPGDLFFWLDGAHGHVAMRVKGNKIAENSSVHSHAGSDARGVRRLGDLRPVDVVIRLIPPA